MNKRLVKKKRPARAAQKASPKAGRSQTVRKASTRAAASRKTAARQAVKTSAPVSAVRAAAAAKKSTATKVSSATKATAAKIVAARVAAARVAAAKPAAARSSTILPISEMVRLPEADKIVSAQVATISVTEVTALNPPVRGDKFRVGQTVSYTSSPISRPGASGSYQVVRLLPSDGDDYQYRIKNPGEAFERVAKESQLELDH